ncbi:unnamed protein product [Bemisia tabaci]|uniref:Uncharacterized protein n=1 Tax=Bemisia tabaci TaxID=7038 RepID=A0A9P0F3J8_BEMTA|nr:unnamed protein product [Bemisia tabaci]
MARRRSHFRISSFSMQYLGGCKHAIYLASWIHRRTEDPAVTSGECLWKKPTLSLVGNTVKFQMVSEKAKPPPTNVSPEELDSFFNLCIPMMNRLIHL